MLVLLGRETCPQNNESYNLAVYLLVIRMNTLHDVEKISYVVFTLQYMTGEDPVKSFFPRSLLPEYIL